MTKTVLIVEDNDLNLKLFEDVLEAEGYGTLTAQSGLGAIEVARDERPDLILMDIQLPEFSGLEATKRLKSDRTMSDIPVVAITAHALPGDEQRILEGGCADYVAKPVALNALVDTLKRHLN